jgi:hypothetical protein
MSYYKYAERDASAQVNWAEIGKNLTQTLQDEVKVREEKKAAIDEATREYDNVLNTAPQGQFDNGNKFTNDYVAQQQKIRMMDDQLLKSGQMDLKTYTSRRQNGIDGTNQLFDLQKNFQSVYSERIKGIMDGSLTAQNSFEMSQVQGFGDFSKAQAMINNVDGRVNIGMTEMGEDGVKRVVPNSAIPVNVLMGKIQAPLASFDVNSETKRLVESQGELVLSLFQAGSLSGAGSITELTGVDAITKFGKGAWTEAATQVNSAIQNSVNAMLANPRNLPSLLTGQVGGYSSESFTYNKDEAEKDKNKILLKPSVDGSPGVMDENGPNYKEQKEKAESWLTTSIKSQMDAKVGKSATPQAQLQERRARTSEENAQANMEKDAENFALNTTYILTGTDAQKAKGMAYMRSRGADIRANPPGKPPGNYIMTKNGLVAFESKGDTKSALRGITGALLSATGANFPEDMVVKKGSSRLGKTFNTRFSGTGATLDTDAAVAKKITAVTDVNLFTDQNSTETANSIKEEFKNIKSIKIVPEGGGAFKGNKITITKPGAKTLIINSNETGASASVQAKRLKDWLNANLTQEEKMLLSEESSAGGELD